MNKIWATINCDLDLSKNGRAMLGEESKWLVLLELVKDRLFGRRSLEHFFRTNYMLNNGTVSQLAWVTPCLDRIRCESWSVIGGSGAFVLPDRSLIAGCVCVEGWGHELTLILGRGYGHWYCPRVEKVVHPTRSLIYCNSRALGQWARSLRFALL